ncbi:alpha-1A adrenergic receptor-like [Orbicella faveolata]|uniref:alpha-1A adrenergic receptor-like n=1 Tax=Orbicella faveolata TaxID=48498 RepID=UPI0009E4B423|nr:alpha-1A adrenergic receptor-like [Orbicella faveolata]
MATEGDTQNVPVLVSLISTVIINGISCPLTVLLNVLVILAVKRRPRLQTNTNILLGCLAATDAVLTGHLVQPSFILWKTLQLLGKTSQETTDATRFHNSCLRTAFAFSSLHLMLVTGERLIAIKFFTRYPYVVTKQNIKHAVTVLWILAAIWGTTEMLAQVYSKGTIFYMNFPLAIILISCVLFMTCSYVILYRETLRQRKKIKTQQLPQEEVERFAKESKALKTTVYIVGAVVFCLLPMAFYPLWIVSLPPGVNPTKLKLFYAYTPWIRTFGILNSLLNPLIYCWRQKEMRKFVFRFQARQVVLPINLS